VKGHGVVYGGLQFEQHVEYYFGIAKPQPVHDVGFFVAEVLQRV